MTDQSSLTLAADAVFALATAVLYAFVGRLTLRRAASDAESRRALNLFAVWWIGLAIATAMGGLASLLGALGILDLNLHVALVVIELVAIVAILWGLLYYLLYIYTGNARWFWPVTWFHLALLVSMLVLIVFLQPKGVTVNAWSVALDYEGAVPGWLGGVFAFLILGPVLIAAIGYATLYFRAHDATSRYRVGMVSGAFILWFGSSAVASVTGLNHGYWWPPASRAIGIVATLIILAAYLPPRALREKYGIERVASRPREPRVRGGALLPVAWRLAEPA